MVEDWAQGIDGLIRRVATGDEEALDLLIQKTGDPMRRLICKYAPALPEDVVDAIHNQVFTKIWLKANEYRGESLHGNKPDQTGWHWISKITRNLLHDYGREQKGLLKREISETDILSDPDYVDRLEKIPDGNAPVEELMIGEQGLEGFKELLTKAENFIIEHLVEGYSQSEIAKKLGVSPPTISQMKRTIKKKASTYFSRQE